MNNILSLPQLNHKVVFEMIHAFSNQPFSLLDEQYENLIRSITYEDILNIFTRQYITEIITTNKSDSNTSIARLIQLNTITALHHQCTYYTYELLTLLNEPTSKDISHHRLYDGKGNNNIMNFCNEIINNSAENQGINTLIEETKAKFHNTHHYEFICLLGESIILLNAIASAKYNLSYAAIENWLHCSLAVTSKIHSSINRQCSTEFDNYLSANSILVIIACKMINLIDKECPESTLYLMKHLIVSIKLCPDLHTLITSSFNNESISILLNE